MSKGDTRLAKTKALDNLSSTTAQGQGFMNQLQADRSAQQSTASSLLPTVVSGYSDIASTGGFDPSILGGVRGNISNLISSGGYDPSAVESLRSGFGNLMQYGGDPTQIDFLRSQGQNQIATGGFDPSIIGALNTGFSNMATTGGISDTDAVAMRNAATRGVGTTYDVLRQEAQRKAAATGGYSGSGAAISQMARQLAEKQAEAVTGANASIAGLRQQGQIAGLSGGANLASNVAAGRRGALAGYSGTEAGITGARQAAGQAMAGLESGIAGGRQAGTALQGGFESGVAGNKIQGVGGLSNVLGMTNSQINTMMNQILESYATTGQISANDLALLQKIGQQPGVGTNILNAIQTIGGAAAGAMTGLGGLG